MRGVRAKIFDFIPLTSILWDHWATLFLVVEDLLCEKCLKLRNSDVILNGRIRYTLWCINLFLLLTFLTDIVGHVYNWFIEHSYDYYVYLGLMKALCNRILFSGETKIFSHLFNFLVHFLSFFCYIFCVQFSTI